MSTVLVTGASGVLGPAVVRAFRGAGHEVTAAARRRAGGATRLCDLTDASGTQLLLDELRPDAVVHLAGGAAATVEELYRNNVLTSVRLADACTRSGLRPHVLLFGSAAEYGALAGDPATEAMPLRPQDDYGRAKVAQAALVPPMLAASDIPWTLLRPFNIVSPRLPPETPLGNVRRQLLQQSGPERVLRTGRTDLVRDFVTDRDVADVALRVVEAGLRGTFNVSSGTPVLLSDLIHAAAAAVGAAAVPQMDERLAQLRAVPWAVGDDAALAAHGITCRRTLAEVAERLVQDPET